jgi:hypothetical protein
MATQPTEFLQRCISRLNSGVPTSSASSRQMTASERVNQAGVMGQVVGACLGCMVKDCAEAELVKLGMSQGTCLSCVTWSSCLVTTVGCCLLGRVCMASFPNS